MVTTLFKQLITSNGDNPLFQPVATAYCTHLPDQLVTPTGSLICLHQISHTYIVHSKFHLVNG